MIFDIFVQCIGFIGIGLNLWAVQFNKHWQIVLLKTLGSFAFVVQYVLLRAWTGVAMDSVGIVRNIIFIFAVKNEKPTKLLIIIFCMITLGLGVFSWEGLISILAIIAKLLSTISYGLNSPHMIRMINLPSSGCWLVYNTLHYSLAGLLNELFVIASIIIAEIRIYKKNKNSKNEGENKNGI